MRCIKKFDSILDKEIELKLEGNFEEAMKFRSDRLKAMKRAIKCNDDCNCEEVEVNN